MRIVGHSYLKKFRYEDCKPVNKEGFIDSQCYLPMELDLVCIVLERNGEKLSKIYKGWWTGSRWDGHKLRENDKVLFWKRIENFDES